MPINLTSSGLQGEFINKVNHVVALLINVRKFVEAAIDFPEEGIDFLKDENLQIQLQRLSDEINKLEKQAHQGAILQQGIHVVIDMTPVIPAKALFQLHA